MLVCAAVRPQALGSLHTVQTMNRGNTHLHTSRASFSASSSPPTAAPGMDGEVNQGRVHSGETGRVCCVW